MDLGLHGGRNVPREVSKPKKCDDKATETAQTSIMGSKHNTETAQYISVMHWFIKANKKGSEGQRGWLPFLAA
eukprot:scaffold201807_cov68-Attheya_sp.AAC.2